MILHRLTRLSSSCAAMCGGSLPVGRAVMVLGLLAAGGIEAAAHPHVWVTSRSQIVVENDRVTAVAQSWTFDEFYTAMAIQGLDADGDGQYSRAELDELARTNMEGLQEFGYFTYARQGETVVPLGAPRDAYLDYTGGVMSLNFTLPLAAPPPRDTLGLAFATFDPSYFIAFELAKEAPVVLTGAPADCRVALRDTDPAAQAGVPPAAAQNGTLTGAFAEQFGAGAVTSLAIRWATIGCGEAAETTVATLEPTPNAQPERLPRPPAESPSAVPSPATTAGTVAASPSAALSGAAPPGTALSGAASSGASSPVRTVAVASPTASAQPAASLSSATWLGIGLSGTALVFGLWFVWSRIWPTLVTRR